MPLCTIFSPLFSCSLIAFGIFLKPPLLRKIPHLPAGFYAVKDILVFSELRRSLFVINDLSINRPLKVIGKFSINGFGIFIAV